MHRDGPFFSNIDRWLFDGHGVCGRVVCELKMPVLATCKREDEKHEPFIAPFSGNYYLSGFQLSDISNQTITL